MEWEEIRCNLFPDADEDDEGFRQELLRQGSVGLRVCGWINVFFPLFFTFARFVVAPDPGTLFMRLAECTAVVLLGILTISIARLEWVVQRVRLVGSILFLISATILIWFSLCMCEMSANADDFIPGQVTMILLVGVAALPLLPMHTLGIGAGMIVIYSISAKSAEIIGLPLAYLQPTYVLFMIMLTILGTVLTSIVYSQRSRSYFRYQQALQAERNLQEAQRRVLLSESAASLGRLAAALSHELNSPIGALSSAVETMVRVSEKQQAQPVDPGRFSELLADLRRSIMESAERLRSIVGRMQRIANLDRSEVQKVHLHELLHDVIGLCEPRYRDRVALEADLAETPPMICKPQQLSAVFRNLINNSVDAVNGGGRIRVSARARLGSIEVEIADNGRGMSESEISHLFDPGFRVADGRVGTGNWSMFSSRQVVREHGGEIDIESKPGEGTRVRVTLPLQNLSLT